MELWAFRTVQMANAYEIKATWKDKSRWFWYWSLVEEVIELGLSLLGLHKDPPKLELLQIGSVSINFLRHLHRKGRING